ncbi:F-box only protein 39 [Eupeodes corollae]|uniref:F-box only protein 39 n=1 Tax=Eupeodes corollae TaxID=290404 RepID=UPI002490280E|nr:F-box only protein 39 [Eupeodes corollae]
MSEKVQRGCWKIDQNEEACYIDVEENDDEDCDPNKEYSQWSILPDLLLEEIFSYLSVKERYYASLVCRHWYSIFHMPRVWTNFVVDDQTLTRTKYNYYSGWQYVLDHMRTQNFMQRVGRHIGGLVFRPLHSFNNIFQFMTLLSWSIEKRNERPELTGVGLRIRSLVYEFPCNMSQTDDPEGIKLFGTGGQLLKCLKNLMTQLTQLRVLKLIDFVLERYEANHLLDEVLDSCFSHMRVLNLVNVTTTHCPIMHVGLFANLRVLTMSPQNIDDDVINLLADSKLEHLNILQNRYTPIAGSITACGAKAWRALKRDNPSLKVHLRVESASDGEILLQPEAPVYSILYNAPKTKIKPDLLIRMVDHYKGTLTTYGHELLPKFVSPKSFDNRVDSLILLLCRQSYNLETLIIREKISTSTVLLITKTAKNLQNLYIRRFAVILRCDWPRNPDWSDDFYYWLRRSSKSYEIVEKEVSAILGKSWRFLSDSEFKKINLNDRKNL